MIANERTNNITSGKVDVIACRVCFIENIAHLITNEKCNVAENFSSKSLLIFLNEVTIFKIQ